MGKNASSRFSMEYRHRREVVLNYVLHHDGVCVGGGTAPHINLGIRRKSVVRNAPVVLASGKELPVPTEYKASISQSWSGHCTWCVQVLRSPKEAFAAAMQSWRERCEKCVCIQGDDVEK